jgi:hypothetical protein
MPDAAGAVIRIKMPLSQIWLARRCLLMSNGSRRAGHKVKRPAKNMQEQVPLDAGRINHESGVTIWRGWY